VGERERTHKRHTQPLSRTQPYSQNHTQTTTHTTLPHTRPCHTHTNTRARTHAQAAVDEAQAIADDDAGAPNANQRALFVFVGTHGLLGGAPAPMLSL
jgi:hypothetical protein